MEWLTDFAELGPLAVICLGLLFIVWNQSERYAKVIEGNTEAMARLAASNEGLKEVLDKQGVMLTQQNFLFQQMMMNRSD